MDRKQVQDLFLLLLFLCPFLVFMVSSSRLPLYLLPLFVPLSLLAARGLESVSYRWGRRWLAWITVWCLLLVSLRIISAEIQTDKDASVVAKAIQSNTTNPYTEIAFYATTPVLGLNFYLDKEVENVPVGMLEDELGEMENPLWVMRSNDVTTFLEGTAKHGRNFRKVGQINERYLLFQE